MPTNVLIISNGLIHPSIIARFWLSYALTLPGSDYQYKSIRSMEELTHINLNSFQAIVLYFHKKNISEPALQIFEDFVLRGGGVFALHAATASFKDQLRWGKILGGRFLRHEPLGRKLITPSPDGKGLFRNIPEFSLVDEIYVHETEPDIQIHFTSTVNGEMHPVIWSRYHGDGRICYSCPGHRAASFRVPEIKKVIAIGLGWVSGRHPNKHGLKS